MKNIKLLIFFVSFLFFLSCSVSKRPKFTYRSDKNRQKGNEQSFYVKRFKDNVFYKCLQYGYGDSLNLKIGKLMAQKDLFTLVDEPFIEENSIQDSLSKKIITNLPRPYIHVEDENSIKGKNFIISTCLTYYESKELQIIAQKFYRKKAKQDKKLWGKVDR